MKLRRLGAGALAVVAAGTLAGCRSNVGVAATVDGDQISESTITSYLTGSAKPVQIGSSDGSTTSVAPRPFVLNILIRRELFVDLLAKTPAGRPSKAQIDTLVRQFGSGSSVDAAVEKLGVTGYSSSFNHLVAEVQQFAAVLNAEVQRGVDVNTAAQSLKFPVSVNPRYGKWDASSFNLDTSVGAGAPGYLELQPTPATGSSAALGGS